MNEKSAGHSLLLTLSRCFLVRKRNIILTEKPIRSTNQNCYGREKKKIKIKNHLETKKSIISKSDEIIIEVPKQATLPQARSNQKAPLLSEIISNTWPLSNERIENLIITNKRCQFSNEAISIKPITAVPGIGKTYGQLLADHGFIYARQLLGYYMMLKDSEMFRKWLEYKFNIPRFRAAEATDALNELIRRTL